MNEDAQLLFDKITAESDFFTKAKLIETLNKDSRVPIKKIGETLGLTSSYVCHILRLNRVPPLVVDGYYAGSLSLSHLFVLSRLKDTAKMQQAYERVLAESMTVAQTEELVREMLYGVKSQGEHISNEEKEELLQSLAGKHIQAKVVQTRIKGKIILEAKGNLEETTTTLRKLMKTLKDGQDNNTLK